MIKYVSQALIDNHGNIEKKGIEDTRNMKHAFL